MNDTGPYLNPQEQAPRPNDGPIANDRPRSDAELRDTLPPTRLRPDRSGALSSDDIPTPPNLMMPAQENGAPPRQVLGAPAQRAGPSSLLGLLVGLALIISLVSLALNVFLIYTLRNAQQTAVRGIDEAIGAVDSFGGEGFHYDYKFNQEIPIAASVPVKQQMVIPFEGEFPINTTVEVPIDAGVLGTFVIDVPINTSVYVNTEVPVNIDETFDFSATIPISLSIPIDVRTDDPQIEGLLTGIRDWLVELRESLTIRVVPPILSGAGQMEAPAGP